KLAIRAAYAALAGTRSGKAVNRSMMCCRTSAGSLFGHASLAAGFARRRAAPAVETAIINTKRSVRDREILTTPPPKALLDAGRRGTQSTAGRRKRRSNPLRPPPHA